MITEEEFIGRINALQAQRDDALNQVVILNGQLQQSAAHLEQLLAQQEKNNGNDKGTTKQRRSAESAA